MKESYYDYEYGTGLVGYEILIRNLQGEITSKSLYDKTGNLIDTGEYQYDGNRNVVVGYGESFYSETSIGGLVDIGVRLIRIEYEYDEEGREIGWKNYDVLGNLIECHESDSDGRYIGRKEYDGSGNLISEEKNE